MTNESKYSNNVRIIEELKKVADADNQKKQAIKSSKKAATAALGSVVLNTPVVKNVKNKIENAIGKIPFSDNMLVGSNKLGLKLGGKDENPKDTVPIKFATPADARATVAKVKKIKKPYARKVQILTVGEQRAKVMGKTEVVSIFKKGKLALKRKHNASNRTG
jgi:hypothetical protein